MRDLAPHLEHAPISRWRMLGCVDRRQIPKRHVLKEVGLRAHNYLTIIDARGHAMGGALYDTSLTWKIFIMTLNRLFI